jgi:uncharacterized protein
MRRKPIRFWHANFGVNAANLSIDSFAKANKFLVSSFAKANECCLCAGATFALCAVLCGCQDAPDVLNKRSEIDQRAAAPMTVSMSMNLDDHFDGEERSLAAAAGDGRVDEVARLVKSGANPNARSRKGMSLLLWPVHQRNLAGFTALLASGARVNDVVAQGDPIIAYVIESSELPFLQTALAHGGKPELSNSAGEPLIHIARRVQKWDQVRALIKAGAPVDAPLGGMPGNSILALAAGFGDFENALWLIENGADAGFTLTRTDAPAPDRVGAQPILEEIFYRPNNAERFPENAAWQKRCQELVLAKGMVKPAQPNRYRDQAL